ncbi:hypothetical protein [Paucilactobacillus kaifaensis]|nr:hypothetical protein [Paucilactobacillus kaifaensis]
MKIKLIIQIALSILGIVGSLLMLKKRFGNLKQEMVDLKKPKKIAEE